MIELALKPYCDNCMTLEPTSATSCHRAADGTLIVYTKVQCKNINKCLEIEKHISEYLCVKEKEKWDEAVKYCDNDVIATEAACSDTIVSKLK